MGGGGGPKVWGGGGLIGEGCPNGGGGGLLFGGVIWVGVRENFFFYIDPLEKFLLSRGADRGALVTNYPRAQMSQRRLCHMTHLKNATVAI